MTRLFSTLKVKTVLGVASIKVVLLAILIYTALGLMTQAINEGLQKRATTAATLFATTTQDALLSYDLASLQSYSEQMLINPDVVYARVLDAEGRVFASAGAVPQYTIFPVMDTRVQDVDDGVFDAVSNISEAGEVYGRVEIGIATQGIATTISHIEGNIAFIVAVEMVLVGLFSWMLGSYLTKQLSSLRAGAHHVSMAVSEGRFQAVQRIPVNSSDEIAEVAVAFNKLVDNLELEFSQKNQFEQMLKDFGESLEHQVQQRTNELESKNLALNNTNQELKAAQKQLLHAEKMASIGQLAAGVAHEINNPVGYVVSNLATLRSYVANYQQALAAIPQCLVGAPSQLASCEGILSENDIELVNADIDDLLHESLQGLGRVQEIVCGLKSFSHADSDEMRATEVNDCIRNTLSMVNNQLKYHCQVELELCPSALVQGHSGRLSQVFTNLLVNAGQAIEKNGRIKVKTSVGQGQVKVYIADNGCGIEPGHQKHLFDPFFTTKPEGQGTGLGLSISYGIVKDHGGDISVKSIVGKGTCFTVCLPMAAIEPLQEA